MLLSALNMPLTSQSHRLPGWPLLLWDNASAPASSEAPSLNRGRGRRGCSPAWGCLQQLSVPHGVHCCLLSQGTGADSLWHSQNVHGSQLAVAQYWRP